jgi:predicted O-linked N-acetylglucosamine transferase (SPINDLY family)
VAASKPRPQTSAQTLFNAALEKHKSGRLAEARPAYKLALEAAPGNWDALHLWGLLEMQLGDHETACRLLERSLQLQPGNASTHTHLGNALQELGQTGPALERYNRALEIDPGLVEANYARGLLQIKLKEFASALTSFETVTQAQPQNANAHANCGFMRLELEQPGLAKESLSKAVELLPEFYEAHYNLGLACYKCKEFEEACRHFERAATLSPGMSEAHSHWGLALFSLKHYEAALEKFDAAATLKPDYSVAHSNRSMVLIELKRFTEAASAAKRAAELEPGFAGAHYNMGVALYNLGQFSLAKEAHQRACQIDPNFTSAHVNLGVAMYELEEYEGAMLCFERGLELEPNSAATYNNLGLLQTKLQQLELALQSFDTAIALNPAYPEAHSNKGNALTALKRLEEALAEYDRAISLKPDFAHAYCNRGLTLSDMGRLDEAIVYLDKALGIRAEFALALSNKGEVLIKQKRMNEARVCFERAYKIKPDIEYLAGTLLYNQMFLSEWDGFEKQLQEIVTGAGEGRYVCGSFPALSLIDDPLLHQQISRIWLSHKQPQNDSLGPIEVAGANTPKPAGEKIRLGYYSADFHNHATAYLMAELFESHDKSQFELFAFSFGPDQQDDMRLRVSKAFDHFIDVRSKSDKEIAQLSRHLGIEIAVDLKGYTQDQRVGIFAYRAAPVQVSYLGYPGTMSAPYIDYILADRIVIPEDSQHFYSEKVVYLPNSYQVNDSTRFIAPVPFTRKSMGLPDDAFVYCCFNNNFKINPSIFDVWMDILREAPKSVLWLLEDNPHSASNLRKEAARRGVEPSRLVFAKRLPLPEHLARHKVADIFLDTLPYNAHTTASDALWAGLPVLTCAGRSFASRVGASLLNAVGLEEMVTSSLDDYKQRAIEFALYPQGLAVVKTKLAANRLSAPLFDGKLFTKHIEDAYRQMLAADC